MADLDLLEKYEPVLRFAKSERFFPMAVEPYLERCSIFPNGPQGVIESLTHLQEPMTKRVGKLKSEQFYLRFVNKPLNDSDAWVWWVALSVIGAAGGWFFAGWAGVEVVSCDCSCNCVDHFYARLSNPIAHYSCRIGSRFFYHT